MAMRNDEVISTLNDLIKICHDGEEGFRTAAQAVNDPELTSIFEGYSRQRAGFASELQSEVERLGGEAATRSEVRGMFHRAWINIRATIQGGDPAAILSEAERGEDAARDEYREALSKPLPTDVKEMLARQSREVEQAHDRIKMQRDQAKRRKAA